MQQMLFDAPRPEIAQTSGVPLDRLVSKPVLLHGDCIKLMFDIPSKSVDMVCCDMPYGTTACKWDTVLPLDMLWSHYRRIVRDSGAIVLTASQPFTSTVVLSNRRAFKYEWIWEKSRHTGFLQSKFMPMKAHENILVFCLSGVPTYNPQKTHGHAPTHSAKGYGHSPTFGASKERDYKGGDTTRFPKTVQRWSSERGLHPTQKPLAMIEYLVATYTNSGDTVLDNCMGSGTTGVACKNLGREFIGIELDEEYYKIAVRRIEDC